MFNLTIKDISHAAVFTALISISAYITIPLPISPVPITLQSLIVMLAGVILTTKQAAFSILTFLLLGLALPIFSGGQSGIGVLAGPTGGYLIGYLIGAVVISILVKNFMPEKNKLLLGFYIFIGGIVIIHLLGSLWLGYVNKLSLREAFIAGSLPFIPGDMLKVVIATIAGDKIKERIEIT